VDQFITKIKNGEISLNDLKIDLEDQITKPICLTWTNLTVTSPLEKSLLNRLKLKKKHKEPKDIIINGNLINKLIKAYILVK